MEFNHVEKVTLFFLVKGNLEMALKQKNFMMAFLFQSILDTIVGSLEKDKEFQPDMLEQIIMIVKKDLEKERV